MHIRLIILLAFLGGCNSSQKLEDTSVKNTNELLSEADKTNEKLPAFFPKESPANCYDVPMPAFDEVKASLLDEIGNPYKDTIIERIPKRRTIFKPCKEYVFKATFLDSHEKLISESQIKMMASGQRWDGQPELQDEVIVQYEYWQEDIAKINEYHINKIMSNRAWKKTIKTGIIENTDQIWMHPFRDNQYVFTEVAPFPDVKFPLFTGKTWSEEFNIYKGWGDWNNSSGNFNYLVEAREDIQTHFGRMEDCWKIKSEATFPFGKSFLDFWFNEKLGFVKMNYVNYEAQKLNIELIEIIEKQKGNFFVK